MLPSLSNGIINSPSISPLENIFFICLLISLGTKTLVILVKSFILFLKNAISAFCSKKSEVINDFKGKNKSILDKIISFSFTKIFGFWSFTAKFNSFRLRCILVLLNSSFAYLETSFALPLIKSSNLSVFMPK